jgi:chromosome segregation ATPase
LGARLDQECKALQQLIAEQRAKLEELDHADMALYRRELESECRLLHEERLRRQDLQVQLQIALTDAKAQLAQLLDSEGPAVYDRQARKIDALQQKLRKYDDANQTLSAKLKAAKEKRESKGDFVGDSAEAADIRVQIAEIQERIREMDKRIAAAGHRQSDAMNSLQQPTIGKADDLDK